MKNKAEIKKANEKRWMGHVAGAEQYSGTLSSYCQEHGLSMSALQYWRKKMIKPKVVASMGKQIPPQKRSAFVPVEVIPALQQGCQFPDPKWLAEFIMNLSQGGRR